MSSASHIQATPPTALISCPKCSMQYRVSAEHKGPIACVCGATLSVEPGKKSSDFLGLKKDAATASNILRNAKEKLSAMTITQRLGVIVMILSVVGLLARAGGTLDRIETAVIAMGALVCGAVLYCSPKG